MAVGLALNPQDNSAWLAGQNTLTEYALNGGLLHTANLPPKLTNPIALVFDYASNGLWLGHIGGLSRFDVRGNYLATIPANVQVSAIGKSPFVIPVPTVALVNPPDHGLINNPKRPLQLIYGALCAGQPCRFPNSYYSGYRLSALLNAQQIGSSFIFDPVTALSSYTPSVRLPEGINTLSAQVTDQNGRISELLNASFTLDTIPPKFLNITPADKSVFQVPQITIQGSVDDPQVYVVLGNYTGPGTNPAKQNFSYPVTLALGGNTFNLSAYDLAGNLATLALTYTYSPLLITIGSPAPNAVIDAKTATVTGSFSGATTATVNVNGVNATVTGTSYGATVPLIYGSNTLTVSATAPNGATASQSVTVTSTFPGISIVSPANGATLIGDNALVTGTVQAPPNSNIGVVVNGVIALVDANNNFYANNVPLTAGANTITATVTNLKGQSNTASVTVNATGFSPFSITADPVQGFAPMTVAFTATSNTGNRIVSWQANPGAAGTLDTTDPTALFKFTYTQPGIYQANVTVTDSAGTTYTKTIVIQVQDLAQMDAMFKAMWSGMNNALVAGDKATAMQYLSFTAQNKYGPTFDVLMPYMPQIVTSYSPLMTSSISNSIGEYAVVRNVNGVHRIFLMYFLRGDTDGVWRINEPNAMSGLLSWSPAWAPREK